MTNSRGDIEELRHLNGSLIARYKYDAWGNTLSIVDASGNEITSSSALLVQNPFRYRGYYYDNESGLYYLQSRYYDPETGRFLNADDVNYLGMSGSVLSYNAFTYCENNAIVNSDPTGSITINVLCIKLKNIILKISNKNTFENHLKTLYGKSTFGDRFLKIKIQKNTIKITAKFKFHGDLRNHNYTYNGTKKKYKEWFIYGIEEYWKGTFKVFGYEVELETDVDESRFTGFDVYMNKSYDICNVVFPGGTWSIQNHGTVYMYWGYSGKKMELKEYIWVSAHEFGHLLGVGDAPYTYQNTIFKSTYTKVQNMDLEKVLLAFIFNETQWY